MQGLKEMWWHTQCIHSSLDWNLHFKLQKSSSYSWIMQLVETWVELSTKIKDLLKIEVECTLEKYCLLLKIYIKETLYLEILSRITLYLMLQVMHFCVISDLQKRMWLGIHKQKVSVEVQHILLLKCWKDLVMVNQSIGIYWVYYCMKCLWVYHHTIQIIRSNYMRIFKEDHWNYLTF